MIIKKKLAKKTTKGNRWRPRKEFKPKHKRVQEQGLASTEIVEHKMPKHERIFRMPNKDKSIFYLFVFSIVLFLCSLLISFIKKHDIQELQTTQDEETAIATTTWTEAQEIAPTSIVSITQTVENMYGAINSKSFDELSNYRDASLKNSDTVRTYFNTKWLTRFLGGIKDWTIAISNVQQEQIKDYSRKVTYTLTYTLPDNQIFEEQRNATVMKRNDAFTIATIKCETTGCSRMPFFNPGKYGIK
jgi:hypothetical protein